MTYFSDREGGERPRDIEEIDETAWGAIRALIAAKVDDGSFGASYPHTCSDSGSAVIGTNFQAFWEAMRGEIRMLEDYPVWLSTVERPGTIDILDIVVFCWRTIGDAIQSHYHDFRHHHHLTFDRETGRQKFRDDVNRILARNGLAYQLTGDGSIERLTAPIFHDELKAAAFNSGDIVLDQLLESARRKFLDRDPAVRSNPSKSYGTHGSD